MITGYFHRKTGRLWIYDEAGKDTLLEALKPLLHECEPIVWTGIVHARALDHRHLDVTTVTGRNVL